MNADPNFKISSRRIFISGIIIFPFLFYGQGIYNVKDLGPLKTNSNAVIRINEYEFTVVDLNKAIIKQHLVVTILNEKGENAHSTFRAVYDKLSRVRKLDGVLYDSSGNYLEKLKDKDILDIGISSFVDDVTDARIKIARFDKKNYHYPYTVEFDLITETENLMFYPKWRPIKTPNTSIESSSFTIVTPKHHVFRYKELNLQTPGRVISDDKKTIHTWSVKNIAASETEDHAPPNIHPIVLTAPVEFEVEGFKGNIQSWADVGKFYGILNENREELPENIKLKVRELTQSENSKLRKVEKLYSYLQSNSRYMSIQLGIGGWQSMTASEVANKGYGDCKALSNYMKALLKETGIMSYQALVSAGSDAPETFSDFPCIQFNHVITCVPLDSDTLWLECTSQTASMGYQGAFTGNRKALLILPTGGMLVNTTMYDPLSNSLKRNAVLKLDSSGNAKASVKTVYTGIQQDEINDVFHHLNKEEQRRWLIKNISIHAFELKTFSFSETKGRLPQMEETLELNIDKFARQSGSRIFIKPNLIPLNLPVPAPTADRKNQLYLNPNDFKFTNHDSINIQLPKNYIVEYLPAPIEINSKFGKYSASFFYENKQLIYVRTLKVTGGTYPSSEHKEWIKFLKAINKNETITAVFTK